MAPTLRKRSKCNVKYLEQAKSSDSDDYAQSHRKQQIERSKNVQKKVTAIHDFEGNSNSIVQSIEIKDKSSKRINVTEDNTSAKSIDSINYPKRKNRMIHRKNNMISDDSFSDSDTSPRQIKRKRLKSFNDKKKTNSKVEPQIHIKTIENQCKQDCCSNLNLPGPSTFINQNKLANKEKEETVYNSKLSVMARMEELIHTFSKFEQQIKRFMSMFAKNNFMTSQDAEDAMFVSNCIVNKAKEELTEHQRLMTYYTQQCMKHKCKYIIQSKQCASTNNVQTHNDTCSRYSTNSKTVSPNLKETSGEAIENLRKNDQTHNECIMQQQKIAINNDNLQMQNTSCLNSGIIVSPNLKEQLVIKNSKAESNKNDKDMQQESVSNTKDVQPKQCVKNDNVQVQNEEDSSSTTDTYVPNFKKQSAVMAKNSTNNFYDNNKGIKNQESIRNVESKQYKECVNTSNLETQNVMSSDSDIEIFSPNYKPEALVVIENSGKSNKDVRHQKASNMDNNAKNKQRTSYENLQVQDDTYSHCSNDTIIIQRSFEEQQNKTKDLKNTHQQDARNGKVEALLGRTDTSAFEIMNNVMSENNRISSPSLVDESQLLNSCLDESEVNEDIPNKELLVNCDSDVSSTCSTVTFFPIRYRNIQNVKERGICETDEVQIMNTNELKNRTSHTLRNLKDDEVSAQKIRRIDSDETIIVPRNKRTIFNKQLLENTGYNNLTEATDASHSSSSDENIFSVKKLNSNVSNISRKSTSENKNEIADKKLGTKCQVVIEKFKFS
ncbi:unnamed protein product [Xylocopa violacea]|uniref:Uncharacterized protein n=1 Tax=Xylocopa violacea TaxID=135666 RepID=A0ABP1NTS7_XYLVO